jgi:flagellar biogenesis protein FliO
VTVDLSSPGQAARRRALVAAVAALAVLGAVAGGEIAGGALRALSVVALLGLGALLVRRAGGARRDRGELAVVERHALARDAGVALVTAGGRRLVVGYGASGVALLARLDHPAEVKP